LKLSDVGKSEDGDVKVGTVRHEVSDKSSIRPSFAAGERQGQRKQDMPDRRSSSNYFSKIVEKNSVFR
jgi:hypothetical protein